MTQGDDLRDPFDKPDGLRTIIATESPLTILVIGRVPMDSLTARALLASSSFVVIEAATWQDALEKVRREPPDCILLNDAPDLDGLEAMAHLKKPDGRIPGPVIMLMAQSDAARALAAIKAGAFECLLTCDLDQEMLRSAVKSAVCRYRAAEENRVLSLQHAHLAAIVAASSDAIISVAADRSRIRSWSSGATRMFGYDEAEAVGRNIDDLIVGDDHKQERAGIYAAARDERRPIVVETERLHKDGAALSVELNISAMISGAGEILGYSVIFRDISDRKLARQLNSRFLAAESAAGGFVYDRDPVSDTVWRSAGVTSVTGWMPNEIPLTNKAWFELVHPDDRARLINSLRTVLVAPNDVYSLEYRVRRKDGHYVWVWDRGRVERGPGGRFQRFIGSTVDITERKLAEAALRERIEHQQLLLDVTTELIATGHDAVSIAQLVSGKIAPSLDADVCLNHRLDATGAKLNLVFEQGLPATHRARATSFDIGETFCGEVAASCRGIAADAEQIATDPKGAFFKEIGVTAYVCHPLRGNDGRMLGTLSFGSTRRISFTLEEVTLLQTVSNFVAQAWETIAAETALRDSEGFSRSVFEASPDCVKILSLDGRLEEMNTNGQCLMEVTDFAALRGRYWPTLWPERSKPDIERAMTEARSGRTASFTALCPTFKGALKWWDVMVTSVPGADGLPSRLIASSRDISAAREAEISLRAAHDTFRQLVEQSPFGVYAVDSDFRLAQVSDGAQKVFENVRPLIGRDFAEILHILWPERFANEAIARFRHTLTTGEPYHAPRTTESRHDVGAVESYDWKIERITLPDGRFGVVCHFYDLSERARHEAALRESEERFRTIFNTAHEGIWAVDREGVTVLANPRLAEMLGTNPAAMTGKSIFDFCFPDSVDLMREHIAANLAGRPDEFEFCFRRADGSALYLLAATAQFKNREGEVIGALGGFVDLSEHKRAEDRQRMLMKELAHRGKNLIAVIQSIAGRSLTGPTTLAKAREAFIGRLHAMANTYGTLIDDAFEGAPLNELVSAELSAFSNQVRVYGPRILLATKIAQTFALLVHELATNAVKYGALSVPDGLLTVSWSVVDAGDERRFQFNWRETGGPPARTPTRRGFGTALISRVVGAEFKCTPQLLYREAGFSYGLDAPLDVIGLALAEASVREKLQAEILLEFYDSWSRQLRADGGLPVLERFNREHFAATGGLTLAEISSQGSVSFYEVGRALTERLGRLIYEGEVASEDPGSVEQAYERCARHAVPCYEHLRFDFGDGNVVTFERLLVPFARGGKRVTHIAGLVVYSGDTRR